MSTSPGAVTFSSFLNGGNPSDSLQDAFLNPGLLNVSELSLLPGSDLDALQPGSFILATLTFQGLAAGTSILSFDFVELTDSADPAQLLPVSTQSASISVVSPVPVPSPSVLPLLMLGLAVMSAGCNCRKS